MKNKVVTFGEIMMRLSPPHYLRLIQTDTLSVSYSGAEANVAASLSNLGIPATFITKLPNNYVGHAARNFLRKYGVDTTSIAWGGKRLGIYFTEKGASQRSSHVIYDRNNSAITEIQKGEINWDDVFSDAAWFHFTGITPALGQGTIEATLEALQAAKKHGLIVSCDLNYRNKLWSRDEARKVMSGLMEYVDILIANEEDAEMVFNIKAGETDVTSGSIDEDAYFQVAKKLFDEFGLKKVAVTLRESYSASDNGWSALLYDGKKYYNSSKYYIHIVDRVGGGDSFCGGLIYALLNNYSVQKSIEFAAAASCLKHTIEWDFNLVSLEEIETLMSGDRSGRVRR